MGKFYRVFREGFPHHTYTRGIDGNVIFYSTADCIYFITLYACLARRYGITIMGFSLMPNHIHANEQAPGKKVFLLFHCRVNSEFSKEYNKAHGRVGPLFEPAFGYAAKTVGKRIRDNLCYIANNPVVGKLCKDVLDNRWNLLAYRDNDHPFSKAIIVRRSSPALKRALAKVKYFRNQDLPLTYARQKAILNELDAKERLQILDHIISRYNFLDYTAMESFYNDSFRQVCTSFRANSGSEHDIPEDFEDYSNYASMMRLAIKKGVIPENCSFETMDATAIQRMDCLLRSYGYPERQIRRFLHLKGNG